jgi:hypothetical protein
VRRVARARDLKHRSLGQNGEQVIGSADLTPILTKPGAGRRRKQARQAANGRVGGIAGTAVVVTTVISTRCRLNQTHARSRTRSDSERRAEVDPRRKPKSSFTGFSKRPIATEA